EEAQVRQPDLAGERLPAGGQEGVQLVALERRLGNERGLVGRDQRLGRLVDAQHVKVTSGRVTGRLRSDIGADARLLERSQATCTHWPSAIRPATTTRA